MAKRTAAFNLSDVIRAYRKEHRGVKCRDAYEAIKKENSGEKINEGTFKSTFYKLAGKSAKRGRPRSLGLVIPGGVTAHGLNGETPAATREALALLNHFGGPTRAKEFLDFVADVKDAVLA